MQIDIWVKYNETKKLSVLIVKYLLKLFRISVKVIPHPKNKINYSKRERIEDIID